MTNYNLIKEFHHKFSRTPDPIQPDIRDANCRKLRAELIFEEFKEVIAELGVELQVEVAFDFEANTNRTKFVLATIDKPHINLRNLAKELADLLYVTYGTAAAHGLPVDKVYGDVHTSNMSKVGPNGEVLRREDGKVLKGPNYAPPALDYLQN
jgi:predicted HAD superfamily Cof-like phosphohydrolase